MNELITKMSLEEMQETFGGKWTVVSIDGKPTITWIIDKESKPQSTLT